MMRFSWVRPMAWVGVCLVLGWAGLSPALADKAYVSERGQGDFVGRIVAPRASPQALINLL